MRPDHYATLGVAPSSEDVVIRAAYLALMRRYHPDKNPSAGAAVYVRAITAAYAVLGDPDKRAEYDWTRAHTRSAEASPNRHSRRPKLSPTALFPKALAAARRVIAAVGVLFEGLKGRTSFNLARARVPSAEAAVDQSSGGLKPCLANVVAVAAVVGGHFITATDALLRGCQRLSKPRATTAHIGSAKVWTVSTWWPPRSNLIPLLGAAGILTLLLFVLVPPPLSLREQPTQRAHPTGVQIRQAAAPEPELDSAARCSSAATSELIKRELFRRAARLRGSDRRALEMLAGHSVIRMNSSALSTANPELATFSCRASVAVDLPPGVALPGGRRSLKAYLRYSLKTVDGGGIDAVTVVNEGGIAMALATVAQILSPSDNQANPLDAPAGEAEEMESQVVDRVPLPPPPPMRRVEPQQPLSQHKASFSCRFAKSQGEIAVCSSANLAALDRNLALLYSQSLGRADPAKRALLIRNHSRFVAGRDACSSEACIRGLYIGRLREITAVMSGQQPSG